MSLRDELTQSLALMDVDNAPTPERQTKAQFSVRDNIWRVRTIAERLHGAHRIDSDVYNSCQKWAATYILLNDGPGAIQSGASGSIVKHDRISFIMEQALRSDSIPAIREFIGKAGHNLLVLTLYECFSASALSSMFAPERSRKTVSDALDRECISVYSRLNEFYKAEHLKRAAGRGSAKTC